MIACMLVLKCSYVKCKQTSPIEDKGTFKELHGITIDILAVCSLYRTNYDVYQLVNIYMINASYGVVHPTLDLSDLTYSEVITLKTLISILSMQLITHMHVQQSRRISCVWRELYWKLDATLSDLKWGHAWLHTYKLMQPINSKENN